MIARALPLYEGRLKSVSFLPLDDHGYAQAPYQTIDEAEYKRATAKLKPINLGSTASQEAIDMWCDGEACELPQHVDTQPSTSVEYV